LRKTEFPTFAPNYITLEENVSTLHRGKGVFTYTPTPDDEGLFLRFVTPEFGVIRK
jgi:hypothetical protein